MRRFQADLVDESNRQFHPAIVPQGQRAIESKNRLYGPIGHFDTVKYLYSRRITQNHLYMLYFSRYRILYFVVLLAAICGFSACQRAPQAYFAPTAHPAPQRLITKVPAATPTTAALITASVSETPPVPAKPAYELAAGAPVAEPAIHVEVSRPTVWQSVKRMMPGLPGHRKLTPPGCDQIVLRNGDVVDAKVKEVGVNEIRYKKCDRQDGPDYTISKRDVLSIKYSNGEVERFTTSSTQSNPSSSSGNRQSYDSPTNSNSQNNGPRTDPFAIVAIATGGLAVLTGYGAFLLGAAGIIFGALSLSRIRKEPGRFKGKGLAIAGMVAGLVAATVILLYILL